MSSPFRVVIGELKRHKLARLVGEQTLKENRCRVKFGAHCTRLSITSALVFKICQPGTSRDIKGSKCALRSALRNIHGFKTPDESTENLNNRFLKLIRVRSCDLKNAYLPSARSPCGTLLRSSRYHARSSLRTQGPSPRKPQKLRDLPRFDPTRVFISQHVISVRSIAFHYVGRLKNCSVRCSLPASSVHASDDSCEKPVV